MDTGSASRLNFGPKNLNETLILHTLMGKDHFISVTGEYRAFSVIILEMIWQPYGANLPSITIEYTCFGNKLSMLSRLRGSIRSLATPDDLLPDSRPINAPREIMRLINWMMSDSGHTVSGVRLISTGYVDVRSRMVYLPCQQMKKLCVRFGKWVSKSFTLIVWFHTSSLLTQEKSSPFHRITSHISCWPSPWHCSSCWIHCRNR